MDGSESVNERNKWNTFNNSKENIYNGHRLTL